MDTVKSRRAEYAEQTRVALLDAAREAFAADGFSGTSISAIAAAARVTKGAVYHHFSDKSGLFEAVMDRQEEAAQARVHAAIAQHPDDVWEAAMAAVDATLDVCCDPVAGPLIYLEGPVGLGWRRWRDYERKYVCANVELMLREAITAGIYADTIPVNAMTQVVSGMITHAGIALAEASARQRNRQKKELRDAITRVLERLREQPSA
jgi:AcrR family transcriptional regulator